MTWIEQYDILDVLVYLIVHLTYKHHWDWKWYGSFQLFLR